MDFRYNDVLSSRERMIFELRLIYAERGYVPYKMSKFEEYDLYGKNRDFLLSDKVITFTDTNGKLMALKPDVTLSIIKNTNNANGSAGEDYIETSVQKLYYNESVYRVAKSTDSFKEIMQVGAECIGDVGIEEITEMLEMAVLSMGVCKSDAVLDVSNLDILSKILSEATESGKVLDKILKCIEDKNIHGIKDIFRAGEISDESAKAIIELIGLYGKADEILDYLPTYAKKYGVEEEAEDFRRIINALPDEVRAKIIIDFSEVGDMSYYNGIIFKGFVEGIPGEVLSGGQYDKLLRKMKRKASGIGFAINMDVLERVDTFDSDVEEIEKIIAERDAERRMLNVALPKGRLG
ncbi:MAG: ATP phosphoribosyltransferase regulatory subunit, partial [Mogibacterium sp.]|nr:ATP phosphoribosyltransferase regulatory subunit [Mogibacterium sp.]